MRKIVGYPDAAALEDRARALGLSVSATYRARAKGGELKGMGLSFAYPADLKKLEQVLEALEADRV